MKFQTIKSVSEVSIPGVTITTDYADKQLKSITFSIGDKPVCRAVLESYSMSFQRPADPETKEVHRVAGTVLGFPVQRDFESKWQADEEVSRLRSSVTNDADAVLTVEKVKVEVE